MKKINFKYNQTKIIFFCNLKNNFKNKENPIPQIGSKNVKYEPAEVSTQKLKSYNLFL